jgi:hypothetical protein
MRRGAVQSIAAIKPRLLLLFAALFTVLVPSQACAEQTGVHGRLEARGVKLVLMQLLMVDAMADCG